MGLFGKKKTAEEIKELEKQETEKQKLMEISKERLSMFKKEEGNQFLAIDFTNNLWMMPKNIMCNKQVLTFSELLNYELVVDGQSITKGGLGSAVIGGALLGGAGLITGGVLGKKTKDIVNKVYITISTNNPLVNGSKITILNAKTKKGSFIYNTMLSEAERTVALLDRITAQATEQPATVPESPADAILKFKNLLDLGVITQSEFEEKKTQLLNM